MHELPQRKNIRLKEHDYSKAGMYFVTICVKDRYEVLGKLVGAALAPPDNTLEMLLSEYGRTVKTHIESLHKHYDDICVNKYVIMPNHIHMIILINTHRTYTGGASAAPTLGNLIRGFKAGVSRECGFSLFQRLFHDHIIRNEENYQKIWHYIDKNPQQWENDKYYDK